MNISFTEKANHSARDFYQQELAKARAVKCGLNANAGDWKIFLPDGFVVTEGCLFPQEVLEDFYSQGCPGIVKSRCGYDCDTATVREWAVEKYWANIQYYLCHRPTAQSNFDAAIAGYGWRNGRNSYCPALNK